PKVQGQATGQRHAVDVPGLSFSGFPWRLLGIAGCRYRTSCRKSIHHRALNTLAFSLSARSVSARLLMGDRETPLGAERRQGWYVGVSQRRGHCRAGDLALMDIEPIEQVRVTLQPADHTLPRQCQHIGQGGVCQGEGRRLGDGPGHVGHAVMNDAATMALPLTTIRAPAWTHCPSLKPLPMPAALSTRTLFPWAHSSHTPARL